MKYIAYKTKENKIEAGILMDDMVVPYKNGDKKFVDVMNIIETELDERKIIEAKILDSGNVTMKLSDVELVAPILHPRQDVICLGLNYTEHAKESAAYKKENFSHDSKAAVYFSKRVLRATGCMETIPSYSKYIDSLDYEVELAVVIGRECKNIIAEKAQDYIFGYTVVNDVSARCLQKSHMQWYLGKSPDGFFPMGPCIVSADEINPQEGLNIQSRVNGEVRQNSNTSMMIHGIGEVIEELSRFITLLPGTIIAMGTPAGVGMGMKPPCFLKPGDFVECEIEGIGVLKNTVI